MKPDWCDEKTWECAKDAVSTALGGRKSLDEFSAPIASALVAARKEAFEDAAGFIEDSDPDLAEFIRSKAKDTP